MVSELLTAAGIPNRCSRFTSPPAGTFATWTDDVTTDGPDGMPPCIFTHNVTVELYEFRPDAAAVAAIEAALSARGLHWSKQDRYWIASEQMYQTIYEYSYIEKRRA